MYNLITDISNLFQIPEKLLQISEMRCTSSICWRCL